MYLQKIHIENYRLLMNVDIDLDKSLTLLVGKNNTGKTSITHLFQDIISDRKTLSFHDYPLECRRQLYEALEQYWSGDISVADIKKLVPETKMTLYVDYSDDDENQPLGELRNFIIDMDDTQYVAQIDAVYSFVPLDAEEMLDACYKRYEELKSNREAEEAEEAEVSPKFDRSIIVTVVKELFHKLFSLAIYAVNPSDISDYQDRPTNMLKNLFACKIIAAERDLDESETKNAHPLTQIMNRVFSQNEEELNEELNPVIEDLNSYIANVNFEAQDKINSLMDEIVKGMIQFGYPSAEDMKLSANTNISLKHQILNNTDLTYTTESADESLPSTHNGLGYKNLIKISLMLYDFARELKTRLGSIPVLIIEEPEAHMHPQLQTTFVSFLDDFFETVIDATYKPQVILSTHSSHIANTVNFQQVRYMRRKKECVECKDLQNFFKSAQNDDIKEENLEFLQKYLKLSYCDLYFCDKAILVEGAAERLLLPTMIAKCDKEGLFGEHNPPLISQYYAVAEVGGAYAHKFYEFVDFLEIPTLILTDIDFVNENGSKCQLSEAKRSSNGSIIRWCHDIFDIAVSKTIPLEKVLELAADSTKKTNGHRHIEFQLEENGAYPRSLEESIINVNRTLFSIDPSATEIKLFSDNDGSKTDFALDLLTRPEYEDFIVPSYIKEGLIWLNNQDKLTEEVRAVRKTKRARSKSTKKE